MTWLWRWWWEQWCWFCGQTSKNRKAGSLLFGKEPYTWYKIWIYSQISNKGFRNDQNHLMLRHTTFILFLLLAIASRNKNRSKLHFSVYILRVTSLLNILVVEIKSLNWIWRWALCLPSHAWSGRHRCSSLFDIVPVLHAISRIKPKLWIAKLIASKRDTLEIMNRTEV